MDTTTATIQIPLGAIKPLYRDEEAGTVLFEVPIASLKEQNSPQTLDDLIAQARLDYAKGDFQSFDKVEDLINDLRS